MRTTPATSIAAMSVTMTTIPTDSHSARTATATGTDGPIAIIVGLRSCSVSVDSPLPTRASTGTFTRVFCAAPASMGVEFCTRSRGSPGVVMSTSDTGQARSLRTVNVSGAAVASSVMSLTGTMPTASSVVAVAAWCCVTASANATGASRHALPSSCSTVARSGAVSTVGSARIVANDARSPSPCRKSVSAATRSASGSASAARVTAAGVPDTSVSRSTAVRPAREDAAVSAVRSASPVRVAARSTVTRSGAVRSVPGVARWA